jgi:hypothetical protein
MPEPSPKAPPSDFNIKPPADAALPQSAPAQSAPLQAPPAAQSGTQSGASQSGTSQSGTSQSGTLQSGAPISAADLPGEAGLSSTGTVIGVAILLVLAVAIFFIRGAVRSHLIAGRASPSAAGSAGWALFAFLLSLSVLIVFGLIGNLWVELAFVVPLLVLVLVTLVLFVLLYRAAAQGRAPRRRR